MKITVDEIDAATKLSFGENFTDVLRPFSLLSSSIVSIFGPRLPFPVIGFALLGFVVGPEDFRLPPDQSDAKLKPIPT